MDFFTFISSHPTVAQAFAGILLAAAALANFSIILLERKRQKKIALFDALNKFNSHRRELEIVFKLKDRPVITWSETEKDAANVICFDMFHIGYMVMRGAVSREFCELYYYAIPTTRAILDEYITEIRNERGQRYWYKFDQFVEFSQKYNAKRAKQELKLKT